MGAFGQNYPTHSTERARAETEKTKPALLKPYCEPKSRRTLGMYLQEKQDLSCNRNESLTGEILYKGHCYVERITQEGHRAPWHRHTDHSELAASSSRRPKNAQHCQAGPLSASTAILVHCYPSFWSQLKYPCMGRWGILLCSTYRPFSLHLLGLIPMTPSFYKLWSCPSRHTHIIPGIFVRILVYCLPHSLGYKLHEDRTHI